VRSETSIPSEIRSFFEMFPGQTLLIKGKPGTGKTILSFAILEEVCAERNGLYLSTRVTPDKLHRLFPWIKDVVPARNVVNATPSKIARAMGSSQSSRDGVFDFGTALDFFKVIYEDAEEMDNPMIVVDSLDGVLDCVKPEDRGASLTQSLCDFCHELGTHLILVSETDEQTALDYIVDGVVTLKDTEVYGQSLGDQVSSEQVETRTAREITIEKIRGIRREQKSYIFTLKDGKFEYFPPYRRTIIPVLKPTADIDEDHRSSGIEDFDVITGGLEKGGLTLFVVEHGVGLQYIPFLDQIVVSLAAKGVGVVRTRSVGAALPKDQEVTKSVEGVYEFKPKAWLTWRLQKLFPTTGEYVDFLEKTRKDSSEVVELSLMESRKEYEDFLKKLRRKHSAVVEFIGLDTLEILYGADNAMKLLDEAIARANENRETFIGVVRRGMKSIEMITKLANNHFVFKDLIGSLFIYGVQP